VCALADGNGTVRIRAGHVAGSGPGATEGAGRDDPAPDTDGDEDQRGRGEHAASDERQEVAGSRANDRKRRRQHAAHSEPGAQRRPYLPADDRHRQPDR